MKKCGGVDIKDTWKSEDMVPGDSQWEKLFEEASLEVKQYADFRGKLTKPPDSLYQCLRPGDEISRKIELLYTYVRMRPDQDTAQQGYQDMFARTQSLSHKASEYSSFIVPEILPMPGGTLDDFMKVDNGISRFRRVLEAVLGKCRRTLSGEMEGFLARSYDTTQGTSQISIMFNNADVKFPVITRENDEGIQITHGNYISLMENEDRRVRESAFEGLYGAYAQYSNTLAAAFSSSIKQTVFYAKTKKYESNRQYYLAEDEVPGLVHDNPVQTVGKDLPKLHHYMALRKTCLGVGELHMCDLYVPMVSEVGHRYTYEEAKAVVRESLVSLGEEYLSMPQKGFDSRQIDVYENKGKRSGAYSWGAYDSHSCAPLSFHGTSNDVLILAHEMGHSIHSWYFDKSQPLTYARYKISVAKIAFTCNKASLIRHLLGKTEDKKEKAYLLNHFLKSFWRTLSRQIMFTEFGNMAHKKGAVRESLTAQNLHREYHRLNADYFDGEMMVDPRIGYERERIPHFYIPFYVYQYATGFSATAAISSRITEGESGTLEGYKKLLSGDCFMTPINLLKFCGVDMSITRPVGKTLNFFERLLEEFEEVNHN